MINIVFLSKIDTLILNLFTFSYEYIYYFLQRLFNIYKYIFFSMSNVLFFNYINNYIYLKKNNFFFLKKNYFSFLKNSLIDKKIFFYYYYKSKKDFFFHSFSFFDNSLYNYRNIFKFFYNKYNNVIKKLSNININDNNLYFNQMILFNYKINKNFCFKKK